MTEAYPRPRPQAVTGNGGRQGAKRRVCPRLRGRGYTPLDDAFRARGFGILFLRFSRAREDKPKPFTSRLYSDFLRLANCDVFRAYCDVFRVSVMFSGCYPQGRLHLGGRPASPWTGRDNSTSCPNLPTGPLAAWSLRRDSLRSPNLHIRAPPLSLQAVRACKPLEGSPGAHSTRLSARRLQAVGRDLSGSRR
jgi:hypothetical protein